MKIKTNVPSLEIELNDLANLFGKHDELEIEHLMNENSSILQNDFLIKNLLTGEQKQYSYTFNLNENLSELEKKSIVKKMLKNHFYLTLTKELKVSLPWGSLTGVRPTKLVRDMIDKGQMQTYLTSVMLKKLFYVSKEKADLVANILKNQKCIIRNDNLIDLYINIPICPTRCLYCSFISHQLQALGDKKVEEYIDAVGKELEAVKEIIAKKAYIVRTIYIGGGTPSVLNEYQLEKLLKMITFSVDEFTVECGRADTINASKLDILKKYGVTRISINPQTFCQSTLKRIGRSVNNKQVFDAYTLALERGFVVNMDIIAGLPQEKFSTFKKTITTLLELYPQNITIHTLSIKRGADLKWQKDIIDDKDIEKMVSFGQKTLMGNGYKPYYLYRQKNQLKGLENVGFYRDEFVCKFNIDSMEETNTVIGIGAGAMSKRVFNIENRIERQHNDKYINDYCEKLDKLIEDKKQFFK